MLLASGGAQQVSVWDARSGKTLYTYRSQTRAVVAVAWSPDGKRLACSGNGGEIEVWEHPQTPPGGAVALFRGHSGHVFALACPPFVVLWYPVMCGNSILRSTSGYAATRE
jgi:WD40 repeat protein